MLPVFDVTQGPGGEERVGDFVKPVHLRGRYSLSNVVEAAGGSGYRVIWGYHKAIPTGVAVTVTDVLHTASARSDYNKLNVIGCGGKNIKILSDKTYTLNYTGGVGAGGVMQWSGVKKFSFGKKLPRIAYQSNTGTLDDLKDVAPFILFISDNTEGAISSINVCFYYEDA